MLHCFGFTIQLALLRVLKVKVKNLAFDTPKITTNAWFSMKTVWDSVQILISLYTFAKYKLVI